MTDNSTLSASRRTLLAAGAVGTVSLALLPEDAHAAPLPRRERWEKLVGRTFTATMGSRRIRLRLDAVEDAAHRPMRLGKSARRRWRAQSYVLRFSTRGRALQGTWTLRNARTGRLRVFVVPGPAQRGRRTRVTATFNGWRG